MEIDTPGCTTSTSKGMNIGVKHTTTKRGMENGMKKREEGNAITGMKTSQTWE